MNAVLYLHSTLLPMFLSFEIAKNTDYETRNHTLGIFVVVLTLSIPFLTIPYILFAFFDHCNTLSSSLCRTIVLVRLKEL